jgi:hypothetical protein
MKQKVRILSNVSELHTTKTEVSDPVVLNFKSCDHKYRNYNMQAKQPRHLRIRFPCVRRSARSPLIEAMERKEAEHNFGKIDVGTIDPGKCRTDHGWDNWQIAFANKLNATLGAAGVPINYFIRP